MSSWSALVPQLALEIEEVEDLYIAEITVDTPAGKKVFGKIGTTCMFEERAKILQRRMKYQGRNIRSIKMCQRFRSANTKIPWRRHNSGQHNFLSAEASMKAVLGAKADGFTGDGSSEVYDKTPESILEAWRRVQSMLTTWPCQPIWSNPLNRTWMHLYMRPAHISQRRMTVVQCIQAQYAGDFEALPMKSAAPVAEMGVPSWLAMGRCLLPSELPCLAAVSRAVSHHFKVFKYKADPAVKGHNFRTTQPFPRTWQLCTNCGWSHRSSARHWVLAPWQESPLCNSCSKNPKLWRACVDFLRAKCIDSAKQAHLDNLLTRKACQKRSCMAHDVETTRVKTTAEASVPERKRKRCQGPAPDSRATFGGYTEDEWIAWAASADSYL